MSKTIKVRLKEDFADRLADVARGCSATESEVVRRALAEHFARLESRHTTVWPQKGHSVATVGGPPSFSPPSFPSALPKTPPSLSPPVLFGDEPDVDEPPPGTLLEFRCIRGRRNAASRWFLTAEQVRRWEEVYPDMDILAESRRAREYAEAHGLKTYDGMKAYLVRWFNRGQDRSRYERRRQPAAERQPRTLIAMYGYSTWGEWETTLRSYFVGEELEIELRRLREIRDRWEAGV